MSIFWKDCPHCGSSQPAMALHCACGHCFEPEQIEGTTEALDLLVHEEQLYYEYLVARVAQVRATTRDVSGASAVNPTDRYHDALAAEAIETLRAAEIELAAQSRRVAEAREWVEKARASGVAALRTSRIGVTSQDQAPPGASASFRARQTQKASQTVHQQSAASRATSCPRCTAALAPGSRRCNLCGCVLSEPAPTRVGNPGPDQAGTINQPRRSSAR